MGEQKSGEIIIETDKGPVKMFLTKKAPTAAKKWWMPLAIAVIGAFQAFGTSGILSKDELDARDADMVRSQKNDETQWRAIGLLRDRISYLEGILRVKTPIEQPPSSDDVKVNKNDIDVYQSTRK